MTRRRKRHSPEQIIRKLRDADAMLSAQKSLGEVCQALEVSEQTFQRWRNQYGGMKAEEAKRLRGLEVAPDCSAPLRSAPVRLLAGGSLGALAWYVGSFG